MQRRAINLLVVLHQINKFLIPIQIALFSMKRHCRTTAKNILTSCATVRFSSKHTRQNPALARRTMSKFTTCVTPLISSPRAHTFHPTGIYSLGLGFVLSTNFLCLVGWLGFGMPGLAERWFGRKGTNRYIIISHPIPGPSLPTPSNHHGTAQFLPIRNKSMLPYS